jgi:hypothetical protein
MRRSRFAAPSGCVAARPQLLHPPPEKTTF